MDKENEKKKYNKVWLIVCVSLFAVISTIFVKILFDAEINDSKEELEDNVAQLNLPICEEQHGELSEDNVLLSNFKTIPFVDEKLYLYIKEIYENTNWDIQYSQGDESKFIPYKEQFIKLLNEECCFVDSQGCEQTLSHFGEIDMADPDYDPSHFSYYFYDVDGDGTPELGMTDNQRFLYIFKYEEQANRFILWDEYYLSMSLMGTGKFEWSGTQGDTGMMERTQDGNYIFKVRFLVEGNAKSDNAGDDVWLYFVALPDDIELEEWMLPQATFKDVIYANYFFRVTKEQYEELSEPFYKAAREAYEKREDVLYTYEELVNSTWPKEIKIKQMIVGSERECDSYKAGGQFCPYWCTSYDAESEKYS